jgi:hypothetical protein
MHRRPALRHRPMREYLRAEARFQAIAAKHLTDDGLIPCSCMQLQTGPDGYILVFADDPAIEVFPFPEADFVTHALVERPDLWKQAALRVKHHPSISGSAPVFGVPFRRALDLAMKDGHTKAKYFLPESYREGRYKSLLLHIRRVDDIRGRLLQVEAWQYSPGSDSAHYLHALSSDFATQVVHFDGAAIQYSGEDLDTLLLESRKVKGTAYTKYFRLDGAFDVGDMHTLAVAFLPGEQLYNEGLGVSLL